MFYFLLIVVAFMLRANSFMHSGMVKASFRGIPLSRRSIMFAPEWTEGLNRAVSYGCYCSTYDEAIEQHKEVCQMVVENKIDLLLLLIESGTCNTSTYPLIFSNYLSNTV